MVLTKFWAQALKYIPGFVEEWMNGRWPKANITYPTHDGIMHDVRNLIFTKSCILTTIALSLKGKDDNETALNVLEFVKGWVTYKGDILIHKQPEFWQDPEETFSRRTGDCEDGAILICTLMGLAGVPAWKRKNAAGDVLSNANITGHDYAIFFREDCFDWFVLDWCYWPDVSLDAWKDKIPHSALEQYKPRKDSIWFTFNEEYAWAEHDTVIKW